MGRAESTVRPRRAVALASTVSIVLAVVLASALARHAGSGVTHRTRSAAAHRADRAGFSHRATRPGLADGANRSRAAHRIARPPASHHAVASAYGGLPSWLPRASARTERVLSASRFHHALAIQGDTVAVSLPEGRALVTAVGPQVPEEGRFPVPATTPCTFVVTFARASSATPLDPASFTLIDDLGHLHHPRATAMDGGSPPSRLPRGKTLSIELHDVLPTGEGALAWAPSGGTPIVSWDYTVEID